LAVAHLGDHVFFLEVRHLILVEGVLRGQIFVIPEAEIIALYQEMGMPTGQMSEAVPLRHQLYFLWSVERVGCLYDLQVIGDKDWYRWGAEMLVSNQRPSGGWLGPSMGQDFTASSFGVMVDTAFGLLFLKRSHPMKELTPKLPFKAGKLNQALSRSLQGASESPPRGVSRHSENPER
jgi:hypothetical protein